MAGPAAYDRAAFVAAIERADLAGPAKALAFYLVHKAGYSNGRWPGGARRVAGRIEKMLIATIADNMGISARTVFRALDDLEAAGFLARHGRHGKKGRQIASRYDLKVPPDCQRVSLSDCQRVSPAGVSESQTSIESLPGRAEPDAMRGRSSTQRAAALAAQASEHRRAEPDPTADCSAGIEARAAPRPTHEPPETTQ